MRAPIYIIFISSLLINITAKSRLIIPFKPTYNLHSDDRYTKYLPARVRELKTILKKSGVNEAIEFIRKDRDYNSYIFLLSLKEPKRLCAYSRTEQLFGKTAQELQKIMFPHYTKGSMFDVEVIFDTWISTARKGDTFSPYKWLIEKEQPPVTQTAYISSITLNKHNYIVGAAVTTAMAPDHIILQHRTKALAAQLKKQSFEKFLSLINKDPDPELYFFLTMREPFYRWIAHGHSEKLIGKTPETAQRELFKGRVEEYFDLVKIFYKINRQANRGGGYIAYPWRATIEEPIKLKVAYTFPIEYKKTKLEIGTGYTPFDFPERLMTELPQMAKNTVTLIKDIGLESTISVIKKRNNKKLYEFIVLAHPPYTIMVHLTQELSGKNAYEANAFAHSKKVHAVDYWHMFEEMASFAQEFGGFYAYEYKAPETNDPRMLKIAYLKLFKFNNEEYFVGATCESYE